MIYQEMHSVFFFEDEAATKLRLRVFWMQIPSSVCPWQFTEEVRKTAELTLQIPMDSIYDSNKQLAIIFPSSAHVIAPSPKI